MIILELEKRCTGNRIVGSNSTLSAIFNDLGTGTKRDSRNFANLLTQEHTSRNNPSG
jgi:hypothetical protein